MNFHLQCEEFSSCIFIMIQVKPEIRAMQHPQFCFFSFYELKIIIVHLSKTKMLMVLFRIPFNKLVSRSNTDLATVKIMPQNVGGYLGTLSQKFALILSTPCIWYTRQQFPYCLRKLEFCITNIYVITFNCHSIEGIVLVQVFVKHFLYLGEFKSAVYSIHGRFLRP